MNLRELAESIGATYQGDDIELNGAACDSRFVQPGNLFVCIKGKQVDGHNFGTEALAKGAAAFLVEKSLCLGLPEIIVEDTVDALGKLAAAYRQHFSIPVIGLTGSCGKTGTREMIAAICREMGNTHVTQANYNSQIGLPLTLLGLKAEHQYAVVEMGISLPGEMANLASTARPSVALVTNIRGQHLEGLGSLEGISQEKSDIFAYLTQDGIAIVNTDEPFAKTWGDKIGEHQCVGFGIEHSADITASNIQTDQNGCCFTCHTPIGNVDIHVPLLGEHTAINALAAASTAMAVGASLDHVQNGLAKITPVKGRLCPHRLPNDITVIDDTYNASLSSVEAAITLLGKMDGKRIFVMTNMGELAEHVEEFHRQVGQFVIDHNIDHLLLTGDENALAFTLDGCDERAQYFASKEMLLDALKALQQPNTTIVVKGSRGNRMETIVDQLIQQEVTC